jgi:hypothetical protein
VQTQQIDRLDGSRSQEHLAEWFEAGLANGQFDVPNGRHIVLNEFPRMMKLTRLQQSAGVDSDSLREFLLGINPTVTMSSSAPNVAKQFGEAGERLPRLCKLVVSCSPKRSLEQWYVYTPALEDMRQGWRGTQPFRKSA